MAALAAACVESKCPAVWLPRSAIFAVALAAMKRMEGPSPDVADRTARLVAATERSRGKIAPMPPRPKGEEIEDALRLAAEFPARRRGALEYPVLKHLVESRSGKHD